MAAVAGPRRARRRAPAALSGVLALLIGVLAAVTAAPASAAPRAARVCSQPVGKGSFTCFAEKRTDLVPALSSAAPAGYGPTDLQSAYRLPSASAGSGQTIAVVDAYDDPTAETDLGAYRAQYGLPPCTSVNGCFSKVNQNGDMVPLPAPDTGWAGEISLDLDMVSAACPNCRILLVEASDNQDGLFASINTAVTLGAKVVSLSWGGSENGTEPAYDSAYLNHPGVVFAAATGDSGYAGGASYPATSPYAVAVGGTSLTRSSTPRGWSETAWTGAGSGCSATEAQPAFQAAVTVCGAHRATADVAAIADPQHGVAVYQTFGNTSGTGWQVYGGTSAATPIIAAAYALAGPARAGTSPAGYPYTHPGALFDVTSGSNGGCGAPLCTAGGGWDGPTGLGTPNGVAAFTAPSSVTVDNPGDQSGTAGTAQSLQIHAQDSNGLSMTYSAAGLPPGEAIDPGTGLISGVPRKPGSYPVTATATDSAGASGSTSFVWRIAPAPGTFVGLPPTRLLDTRNAIGAPAAQVPALSTLTVQVTGRGGVPSSGVGAVVLNVTVTRPQAAGYLTVWADGDPRPGVSNLNFVAGQTVPNLVVARVVNGGIDLFNGSYAGVDLIADVTGYYAAGSPAVAGAFTGVTPDRLLDTRDGTGAPRTQVPGGSTLAVQVAGRGAVPTSGVAAVVLNVTVAQPQSAGYLTVWADGDPRPDASNLNFVAGQTVPNLVVTRMGGNGAVDLYNGSGGGTDLIADVTGYFRSGSPNVAGAFVPVQPARVLNTWSGTGVPAGQVPSGATLTVPVAGHGGVPSSGAGAVVANVTVTGPQAGGYLTVWADGDPRPNASNLNFAAGQNAPNLVMTQLGGNGSLDFFNGSPGGLDLLADVTGYYLS